MLDLALWAPLVAAAAPPHIVLSVADDLGWHNVGWRNPEFSTPTLDALRADGVELTRFYTFMYCSPSRASLLTGRLPLHVNQNNEANDVRSRSGADVRMTLLPARLKAGAGYRTVCVGKWHLGARTPASLPASRGCDEHLGFLKGGEDHWTQRLADGGAGFVDLWRDNAPAAGENGTYSAMLYAAEAARAIGARLGGAGDGDDGSADDDDRSRPLFMYLAWQNPHMPAEVPAMYLNPAIGDCKRRTIEAMIHVLDEGVANVTRALRAAPACDGGDGNAWNTTVFVFLSDNGGVTHLGKAGNNYPLRGGKVTNFEGGVRTVAFVAGGVVSRALRARGGGGGGGGGGARAYSGLFAIADWYATLMSAAGAGDAADAAGVAAGVPPVDALDHWAEILGAPAEADARPRRRRRATSCRSRGATARPRTARTPSASSSTAPCPPRRARRRTARSS